MYIQHITKTRKNKVVHFKVNSIAEVADIIDNIDNYNNSTSDLILCDENGIIKKVWYVIRLVHISCLDYQTYLNSSITYCVVIVYYIYIVYYYYTI